MTTRTFQTIHICVSLKIIKEMKRYVSLILESNSQDIEKEKKNKKLLNEIIIFY